MPAIKESAADGPFAGVPVAAADGKAGFDYVAGFAGLFYNGLKFKSIIAIRQIYPRNGFVLVRNAITPNAKTVGR